MLLSLRGEWGRRLVEDVEAALDVALHPGVGDALEKGAEVRAHDGEVRRRHPPRLHEAQRAPPARGRRVAAARAIDARVAALCAWAAARASSSLVARPPGIEVVAELLRIWQH